MTDQNDAAIAARAELARRETVIDRPGDGTVCSLCAIEIADGQKHYRVGVSGAACGAFFGHY